MEEFWRKGDAQNPNLLFLLRRRRFLVDEGGHENHDQIINSLIANRRVNVEPIYPEDYSVQDQLAVIKRTDILLAAHGQGLSWGC